MTAILLTTDLAFLSKFAAAGQRASVTTSTAMSTPVLVERAGEADTRLVALDLTVAGLDVASVVGALREVAPGIKIIAFGPHVHEAKLAAAQAAGCDEVLTRGAFNAQMDELLRRFAR